LPPYNLALHPNNVASFRRIGCRPIARHLGLHLSSATQRGFSAKLVSRSVAALPLILPAAK
jgi:hypothetical protein